MPPSKKRLRAAPPAEPATIQRVLELYLMDTSPLPGVQYCKCYRGINSQPGEFSPKGCCADAARVLSAVIQRKAATMDYWQLDDGDEVESTMHQIGGCLSFVLPHVQGSLAHEKGDLDLGPMLESLRSLSDWADGCLDENPFTRHIEFLTAGPSPGTESWSSKKPMVVEKDAKRKQKKSLRQERKAKGYHK